MYLETDSPINLGSGNNSGFGNGDGWWILIILLALTGGWGYGGGYGYGGGSGAMNGYVLATDFASLERKMDSLSNGICDLGFNLSNTITQGFAGLNTALVTQGYETRNAVTDVGYAIKDCCCTTQRAVDGINYNLATNFANLSNTICSATRDIVDNQNANYRALHDENVAMRIESKDEKIAELQNKLYRADLSASQAKQSNYITDTIINKLSPCPSPSYIVPNPNCCYPYTVTGFGYANNACCNSVQ